MIPCAMCRHMHPEEYMLLYDYCGQWFCEEDNDCASRHAPLRDIEENIAG